LTVDTTSKVSPFNPVYLAELALDVVDLALILTPRNEPCRFEFAPEPLEEEEEEEGGKKGP